MHITLIGINHKTTPLAIREQLAITDNVLNHALSDLQTRLNVSGAIILSTCNRVEVICTHTDKDTIIDWLLSYHHINAWQGEFYCYQDEAAVRHAIKVAAGIDSLVLGEPQILGQFKQAYHASDQLGLINTTLRNACEHVFCTAKAIRHKTAIGHCPVSVAFSAVKLVQQKMQDLSQQQVLLIGAGDTAKLLCRHLRSLQIGSLTIVNRTLSKAQQLAKQFNATAQPLAALNDILTQMDIVISAANSDQPIIHTNMLLKRADQHPIAMIDLGVPRNIDPTVAELDHVVLHCVDDIQLLLSKNTLQRSHAAMQAEDIIAQSITQYQQKLKVRAISHTICSLRSHTEKLRDQALAQSLEELAKGLDPKIVLQKLANRLTNKFTHQPCVNLQTAGIEENTALLAAARQLFSIVDH